MQECVFNSIGKQLLLEQVACWTLIVSESFKREESSEHPKIAKSLSVSSLVMKLTKNKTRMCK